MVADCQQCQAWGGVLQTPATSAAPAVALSRVRVAAILDFGVQAPRRTLLFCGLLWLLLASGLPQLQFDPRYQTFFDADDPQRVAFEHLRSVFAPADSVVFVVDPGAAGLFTPTGLGLIEFLTEQAWQLPFATRVDSLTNFSHSEARAEEVHIGPLVDSVAELDAAAIAGVERIARSEPMIRGRLLEEGGDLTAVAVTVLPRGDPLRDSEAIMVAAQDLAAQARARVPEAEIHLAGIVAMNHAFSQSSLADSARLIPLMLLLILLGLWLLLASGALVASAAAVMLMAVTGALGVAGWLGMSLTTPSALAPIVIVTVAVADCVHIGLAWQRATGDKAARLRQALATQRMPVMLTTLTTAAGFLSMNFSAVPPFRDLGNLVAMGVVLAGLLALLCLPALIMLLPEARRQATWIEPMGRCCARLARPWSGLGLLAALGLVVLLLPGLARLTVNDDFVAYFAPSQPFRQAAELVDERLGGMYEIEYQLEAPTPGGIHDPAWLAEVDAFVAWLRAQPETAHVLAFTDVLKRLRRTLDGGGDEAYRLPDSAEEAAQYTLLYELSLPLGLDVTHLLDQDYRSLRLQVSLRDLDSRQVLAFEDRAERWLGEHAPSVQSRHGGINLMFAHISERNVAAMIEGNLLAVLVIAAILALALRSPGLALISLGTNLLPIALAFAVWGWLVGDVGLAVSAAFGMTLGIVVDDTVHLLHRYRLARASAEATAEAVTEAKVTTALAATLATVGPALIVTTFLLLIGFACLAASSFLLNAQLAWITMLTIGFALLLDLLLLPALLQRGRSASLRA